MTDRDEKAYSVEMTRAIQALGREIRELESRQDPNDRQHIDGLCQKRQQLIDKRELERARYRRESAHT